MNNTAYTYTEMKRQSVKNGIVRCPACGKMAKKHGRRQGADGKFRRMYEHGGVIEWGFAKIKDYCMVEEDAGMTAPTKKLPPPAEHIADIAASVGCAAEIVPPGCDPVGTLVDLAYGQHDLGTRCIISGGEVLELDNRSVSVDEPSDEEMPF